MTEGDVAIATSTFSGRESGADQQVVSTNINPKPSIFFKIAPIIGYVVRKLQFHFFTAGLAIANSADHRCSNRITHFFGTYQATICIHNVGRTQTSTNH